MNEKHFYNLSAEEKKHYLLKLINKIKNSNSPLLSSTLTADVANKFEPFPLTDMQEAFLVGRKICSYEGYVGSHVYFEFEEFNLDIPHLMQAWNRLLSHYDMLRAVILPSGQQNILKNVPPYQFNVYALQESTEAEFNDHLHNIRQHMSHQVYAIGQYPLFEIVVTAGKNNQFIIHVSIDDLIVDAMSVNLLCQQWVQLYQEPKSELPAIDISFRDYVLELKKQEVSESYQASLAYWLKTLTNMPGDPLLSKARILQQTPNSKVIVRHTLTGMLKAEHWLQLKTKAKTLNISPSILLLTLFTEILAIWSDKDIFSMIVTTFNRLPLHHQIKQLIGPLSSTLIFTYQDQSEGNLMEKIKLNQSQIWSGLAHGQVSGVQVLRELKTQEKIPTSLSLGIVFTSMLLDSFTIADGRNLRNWFYDATYRVTQTPQVYLDHQIWEHKGSLYFNWYVAESLFEGDLLKTIFNDYCDVLLGLAEEKISWQSRSARLAILFRNFLPVSSSELDHYHHFPTTDLQQAYLMGRTDILQNGKLGCTNYHEFTIKNVDACELERAWQILINTHEMLRTIITREGYQKLLKEIPTYHLEVVDLRAYDKNEITEKLAAIRRDIVNKLYPLNSWPYFELKISLLNDDVTLLHINIDLMIADGASVELLYQQLFQLYLNPQKVLVKPSISFREYIGFLNHYTTSPYYKLSLDYWQEKLSTIPTGPCWLSSGLLNDVNIIKRKRLHKTLLGWAALKQKARNLGVPLDFILLTAYAEALAKYCDNHPFTIIVVEWKRLPIHPDINSVIGEFASLNWLIVQPTAQLCFTEKMFNYYRQICQDRKHQVVGGLKALRRIAMRKDKFLSFPAVYTSLLDQPAVNLTETIQVVGGLSQTPQVSLDCISFAEDNVLHLHWDTLVDLLPAGKMEEIFGFYVNLLNELSQDEAYWDKLRVLKPEGVNIQHVSNDDLLHSDFVKQTQKNPDLIAVITPERKISYKLLYEFAIAAAIQLREAQNDKKKPIAILMEKGWEQVVAVIGTFFAGFIFLPLDPINPVQRTTYMLENAGVDVVLTQVKLIKELDYLANKKLIAIDENLAKNFTTSFKINASVSADDLAYIIYTSGSTGFPKGVMISHKGARNTILDINQRFFIANTDKVFAISALSFDLSIYDIFGPLAVGAAIVMPNARQMREPSHWSQILTEYQVTIWNSTPALMQMLVMFAAHYPNVIPQSLRLVLLSGDRIPINLPFQIKKLVNNTQIISLGGATEASIWSIIHPVTDDDASKSSIPYGREMLNQKMYVLNKDLESCSVSTEGEIYIGGVGLAKGYLNDREKTEQSFIYHPRTGERLYRTGDIGYYDHNKEIIFVGRIDSQVKVRGFRIELGEIQVAVLEHPAVLEAVVAIKDESSGDPKLVVYLITSLQLTRSELTKEFKEFLEKKLPPYMIPHIFLTLKKIPITLNGKVDYKALPWPVEKLDEKLNIESQENEMKDLKTTEIKLVDIFKEILKINTIDVNDDLFIHGISSLNMVIASEKIQKSFGIIVPIEVLIENPTISGVVRYIGENQVQKGNIKKDILFESEINNALPSVSSKLTKTKSPHVRNLIGVASVVLSSLDCDSSNYYFRASQYDFSNQLIVFNDFSRFLGLLKQVVVNNEVKYLYPSAGKAYVVETYVYIKEGAIENLKKGLYYYHPINHELQLLDTNATFNRDHHFLYNQEHYDKAGFSIYFLAQLNAMAPTYGIELARNFALLEVGHMCQLLMLNQASCNIGLCSIGGINFEKIQDAFKLDSGHFFVHSMLGGYIDYNKSDKTSGIFLTNAALQTKEVKQTTNENIGQIAIVGVSGRYPGANNIDEFWDNLKIGKEVISNFPLDRSSGRQEQDNQKHSRWGGFLPSINYFDNLLFNISPIEARIMDPQERLLLEVVWECLENSGYTNERLNHLSKKVGVFVGVMWSDYQNVGIENWQNNSVAEAVSIHSSIANRISYYFNFRGPSIAVDTSCSSSLTALHFACQSIKRGECNAAIVAGVNLIAHPYHLDLISNLGLTSKANKSFALSGEGSGWIAGEGVGAILVLTRELAEKNHDYIYALIKGTAIGHIGKSKQYGMPNIEAQIESIENVFKSAKCSVNQIGYIETAATGASIADAAEISALKRVFQSQLNNSSLYPLGTIKSIIGHLESASGISQLTKVILQLKHKKIAPTIIQGRINPLLELENSLFFVPRTLQDWRNLDNNNNQGNITPLMALINAFGATGNCGHTILEEYISSLPASELCYPVVIVLSAASETQLFEYAHRIYEFLKKSENCCLVGEPIYLARIAYTLQIGRKAMLERLAIIVHNVEELLVKLKKYLETGANVSDGCYRETANKSDFESQLDQGLDNLPLIAESWVKGATINWERLYKKRITKIPLPTYPFAKEKHWLNTMTKQSPLSQLAISVSRAAPITTDKSGNIYALLLPKTLNYLLEVFSEESDIAINKIDKNASLEDYGINSLLITKLNLRLEKEFGEISKTIFFEYKTLDELGKFLIKSYSQKLVSLFKLNDANFTDLPNKQKNETDIKKLTSHYVNLDFISQGTLETDIAIIGVDGRYPDANNLAEFWNNLKNGKDCISDVPKERWNNDFYYNLVKKYYGSERNYNKCGGFIKDIDKFDALFFNLSPHEAEFMDPQERIFLEVVWTALENACYTPESLKNQFNNNVGVYVGVMYSEYQFHGIETTLQGHPIALSPGNGLIANRISYFLDLHGPSMTVDTMCSSSLTSIHLAVNSLRQKECQLAIAGGVNLLLHPNRYVVQTEMNMASSHDCCKSFGEGGDGYVPGEGAGAVILKPLTLAIQDNNKIYGIIKSSVINNNGKTSGKGVPSPVAQGTLVATALAQANIDPRTITYVEAHGTGTALGDPIEITGLMHGFSLDNVNKQFCAIGSVKSNIGHLEPAAGIAGLTKVLLQFQHKQLVPSLHAEVLNTNINFQKTPFYVQRELSEWKRIDDVPLRAGISAFGAGGSNAHIIVEEAQEYTLSYTSTKPYYLLTISARHPDSLRQRVADFFAYIKNQSKLSLEAIAYTLNAGRAHFEYRCALVVSSLDELETTLEQIQKGQLPENYLTSSQIAKIKYEPLFEELLVKILEDIQDYQTLDSTVYQRKLLALADLYVKGYRIDWRLLHQGEKNQWIGLPAYPFLREQYWAINRHNTLDNFKVPREEKLEKLHPLIDKNASTLNEYCFKTIFNGNEFYLKDHKVVGEKVLPGVVYLEMARVAGELALPGCQVSEFRDITWLSPLIAYESEIEATIRLKSQNNYIHFEVYTMQNEQENLHSQGSLLCDKPIEVKGKINVSELKKQLTRGIVKKEFYEKFTNVGLEYGEGFQTIEWIKLNDEDVLAYYRLPISFLKRNDEYKLHPSIIDSILQAGAAFDFVNDQPSVNMFLPFYLEKFSLNRTISSEGYIHVKWINKKDSVLMFQLLDFDGEICVEINNLKLRQFNVKKDIGQLLYYTSQWQARTEIKQKTIRSMSSLCIIGGSKELYLGLKICFSGIPIFKVENGDKYIQVEQDVYQVPIKKTEKCRSFIRMIQQKGITFSHFILGHGLEQELEPDDFLSSNLRETVAFVQALMLEKVKEDLYFISLYHYEALQFSLNTMLLGFAKSLCLEQPQYRMQLLGLEKSNLINTKIAQIVYELNQNNVFHVRYEGAERFVETYVPIHRNLNVSVQTSLRQQGVYLITGGLGGLGFVFSKYLAKICQAKLVLTGRSELTENKQRKLKELEKLGATVIYLQGDVGDRVIVDNWIVKTKDNFADLHGIIHCAGILKDKLMLQKDWSSFRQVVMTKALGAIYLDVATQKEKLDFFVCFSSNVGCLGNIGQTDYAAANAFLDYFSIWRHRQCLEGKRFGKALSIDWPYWAEGGMQIDKNTKQYLFEKFGILPLPTDLGLETFIEKLNQSDPHVLVLYGQQQKIEQILEMENLFKFTSKESSASNIDQGKEVPLNILIDYIKKIISSALKLPVERLDENALFERYGMDSIFLAELTRQLEQAFPGIPKTLFFEHQTIIDVANYLVENFSEHLEKKFNMKKIESKLLDLIEKDTQKDQGSYLKLERQSLVHSDNVTNDYLSKYQKIFLNHALLNFNYIKISPHINLEIAVGGNGIPMLLIPPGNMLMTAWYKQFEHLINEFRLITFNYPGYGLSTYTSGHCSYENIVDSLMLVLEYIEIELPIVVGWSKGSLLAQILAMKYPNRLRSMILVNPLQENIINMQNALDLLREDFDKRALNRRDFLKANIMVEISAPGLDYYNQILNFDFAGTPGKISVPSLVISGETDKICPLPFAKKLVKNLVSSDHCIIRSAGHFIPLFNSNRFSKLVKEHILSLERCDVS